MRKAFTIQEVVARTGLSVHALRYYERAGLLPPVEREPSGHRRYTVDDLDWLAFLLRLRATGMSIRQMRTYADLRRRGDETACARLALLATHHQQVRAHICELEYHLTAIEKKMQHLSMMDSNETIKQDDRCERAPGPFPPTTRSKEEQMAKAYSKAYYSTIFEQSADRVWATIRDFGAYTWTGSVSESFIEESRSGTEVGAIRCARLGDTTNVHRQRLLAHSDLDRSYTYEFCEPYPYPVRNCVITLRVTPIVDGNRAFVEWLATFDCDPTELNHWSTYFAHEVWARSLEALKRYLSQQA